LIKTLENINLSILLIKTLETIIIAGTIPKKQLDTIKYFI